MKFWKHLGGVLCFVGCLAALAGILATAVPMIDNDQMRRIIESFSTPSRDPMVSAINNTILLCMRNNYVLFAIGAGVLLLGGIIRTAAERVLIREADENKPVVARETPKRTERTVTQPAPVHASTDHRQTEPVKSSPGLSPYTAAEYGKALSGKPIGEHASVIAEKYMPRSIINTPDEPYSSASTDAGLRNSITDTRAVNRDEDMLPADTNAEASRIQQRQEDYPAAQSVFAANSRSVAPVNTGSIFAAPAESIAEEPPIKPAYHQTDGRAYFQGEPARDTIAFPPQNDGTYICATCNKANPVGSVYCCQCGSQLSTTPQSIPSERQFQQTPWHAPVPASTTAPSTESAQFRAPVPVMQAAPQYTTDMHRSRRTSVKQPIVSTLSYSAPIHEAESVAMPATQIPPVGAPYREAVIETDPNLNHAAGTASQPIPVNHGTPADSQAPSSARPRIVSTMRKRDS